MCCVYRKSGWYIRVGPLFGGGPLLGGSVIGGSTVQLGSGSFIRPSVGALYRDGAGRISRDPRTKHHQTRRERLARASKLIISHSWTNI